MSKARTLADLGEGIQSTDLPAITADKLDVGQIGGRRNLIINGAMQVAQRGTSATNVDTAGYKTVDRWQIVKSSGPTFDFEQTTDAPSGFAKSLKATVNTSDTLGDIDYSFYRYLFEGLDVSHLNWGTSDAKTVTLSFWVKSSIAGTYGVLLGRQGTAMYGVQYTINSANTWEYKTATIPGATSGTFATDNSRAFELIFDLGVGSTYSQTAGSWSIDTNTFGVTGAVKLSETTGATFQITGVQLEVGSVATPFEHRSYGEELALCQRYYFRNVTNSVYGAHMSGVMYTTTKMYGYTVIPTMRVSPSLSVSSVGDFYVYSGTASSACTAISIYGTTYNSARLLCDLSTAGTQGNGAYLQGNTLNGWIAYDAEL